MNKKILLISQSPSDIRFVLTLYEKYKDSYDVEIIVVGVKNNYHFLCQSLPSHNVQFVSIPKFREYIKLLSFSFVLRSLRKKLVQKYKDDHIYFFSRFGDYATAYLIDALKKNNTILYVDSVYSYVSEIIEPNQSVVLNIKGKIKKNYLRYLLFFEMKFVNISGPAVEYYDTKNNVSDISITIDEKVYSKYGYSVECAHKKKSILFFESNGMTESYFEKYDIELKLIIDFLCDKYDLYIKPHPSHGSSSVWDEYDVNFLPGYIPAEFINVESFDKVVGIESAALANIRHPKKVSLINFFGFTDESIKHNFQKYITNHSIDDVSFPCNINFV